MSSGNKMVNLDDLMQEIQTIVKDSDDSFYSEGVIIRHLGRIYDATFGRGDGSIFNTYEMFEPAEKFQENYQKLTRALDRREPSYTEINQHLTQLEENFRNLVNASSYKEHTRLGVASFGDYLNTFAYVKEKLDIISQHIGVNESKQSIVESITSTASKEDFLSQAKNKTPYLNTHRNKFGMFSPVNVIKNAINGVSLSSTSSMRRLLREARDTHDITEAQLVEQNSLTMTG